MRRLAHDARHGGKRHLARQHQDKGFEQQREARQPSGKVRLDQAHRTIGQFHARRAHLQIALMLEEVQVPVALGHCVVNRVNTLMTRDLKPTTTLEVNHHGQCLGRLLKVNRGHIPRLMDSQGSFKQLGSHQFTLQS